jgi:hypothetical protein
MLKLLVQQSGAVYRIGRHFSASRPCNVRFFVRRCPRQYGSGAIPTPNARCCEGWRLSLPRGRQRPQSTLLAQVTLKPAKLNTEDVSRMGQDEHQRLLGWRINTGHSVRRKAASARMELLGSHISTRGQHCSCTLTSSSLGYRNDTYDGESLRLHDSC